MGRFWSFNALRQLSTGTSSLTQHCRAPSPSPSGSWSIRVPLPRLTVWYRHTRLGVHPSSCWRERLTLGTSTLATSFEGLTRWRSMFLPALLPVAWDYRGCQSPTVASIARFSVSFASFTGRGLVRESRNKSDVASEAGIEPGSSCMRGGDSTTELPRLSTAYITKI